MKNLILCADGTGNLGGTTPDSNVYRLYNLVDIHDSSHPQLTYYDNGVGTSTNTYWRSFSGAFGFGFKRNVCELYEFLAKHYDPGDQVFLFGFSRGAAEVRALSGFITAAGLVDGRRLSRKDLDNRIQEAYQLYKRRQQHPTYGEHGAIPLTFIGVWDTVSALGFPQGWKVTGVGSFLLNGLFYTIDHVCDRIWPHRFYNYALTNNVRYAYHALAIDDTRLSFSPLVWDETQVGAETQVEQVWFAGAHSNVGGGYGRAGLSYVVAEWMLSKTLPHGLHLKPGVIDEVHRTANVQGRLYDARDGLGIFYRYYPRKIAKLCAGKLRGPVKIHESVLERLRRHTANYAPGHFPSTFEVVGTVTATTSGPSSCRVTLPENEWKTAQEQVNRWTFGRSWVYSLFLEFMLVIVGFAMWYWVYPPEGHMTVAHPPEGNLLASFMGHLADVLQYVLPEMFEGLITVAVIQRPGIFWGALLVFLILWRMRSYFRKHYDLACEEMRKKILKVYP
jgi:uncharacterized protein (DUF2235 family)